MSSKTQTFYSTEGLSETALHDYKQEFNAITKPQFNDTLPASFDRTCPREANSTSHPAFIHGKSEEIGKETGNWDDDQSDCMPRHLGIGTVH